MGLDHSTCCASRSREEDGRDKLYGYNRYVVLDHQIIGPPVRMAAYTEWEEIVALSRAIVPGGKLLGLSSTKRLLLTLHVPSSNPKEKQKYTINLWSIVRSAPPKPGRTPSLHLIGTMNAESAEEPTVVSFLDSASPTYVLLGMTNGNGEGVLRVFEVADATAENDKVVAESEGALTQKLLTMQHDSDLFASLFLDKAFATSSTLLPVCELSAHESRVVALCTNRSMMVSGGGDGEVHIWNWTNWKKSQWRRVSVKQTTSRRFGDATTNPYFLCEKIITPPSSLDDKRSRNITTIQIVHGLDKFNHLVYLICIVYEQGHISVWEIMQTNMSTGNRVAELDAAHKLGNTEIAFTAAALSSPPETLPNSSRVVAEPNVFTAARIEDSHTIQCWNLRDKTITQTLQGHLDRITALAFGPYNNGPLISASDDHTIRVWDTHAGVCLSVITRSSLSPCKSLLVEPNNLIWSASESGKVSAYVI